MITRHADNLTNMDVRKETHAYGDHPRQTVTVHYRDAIPCGDNSPRPGILAIHGGYWAKRSGMGSLPERLAADHGYVVFEIDYRLNTDAPWPAQRHDVTAALAWARVSSSRYNLDADRIAALGSSAGGHLAVSTAVWPDGLPLSAVVALSPPIDPYLAWRDGEDPDGSWADKKRKLRREAQKLAGCPPVKDETECWQRWQDMNAATHAAGAGDPPMMMLHFADDLVPPTHSAEFRDAELAAGALPGQVTTVTLPGRGHGMSTLKVPGTAAAVHAFLAAHLKTPRPLVPGQRETGTPRQAAPPA